MKLSTQIAALTAALIALVCVSVVLFHSSTLSDRLNQRQRQWSQTITATLAESLARDVIDGNAIGLRNVLSNVTAANEELAYAFVTDFNGHVLAHTFDTGFPAKLLHPSPSTERAHYHVLTLDGQPLTDAAFPIIEGMGSFLHLGILEAGNRRVVDELIEHMLILFGVAALLSIMGGLALSRYLTRPLAELTSRIRRFGEGQTENHPLSRLASVEIRRLHEGFREMVDLRTRAMEALSEAKDQAEAGSRSKSEFLAIMSHEIRTPLNVLLGMSEVLEETSLTDEQHRQLTLVHQAGDHLLGIINDILDLSKIEAGGIELERRPFAPISTLTGLGEMIRRQAEESGLEFVLDLAVDLPPWVIGDEGRLRQVLMNLLVNAVKFTEQGRIALRVRRLPESDRFFITIEDTGVGIAPEHLEQVFDKFTQADASISRRYGGTSLGLTISRNLVALMGGTIEVESQLGDGSIFRITLPLPATEPPMEEPLSATGAASARSANTETQLEILLVEDSLDNQALIRVYLNKTAWRLETAMEGEEALEKIKAGRFDLVLMDIQMPVMDGYTATREIRAWEREQGREPMPILALSAHALESEKTKSLEAGCDAHLTKPLKKAKLLEAIARYAATDGT